MNEELVSEGKVENVAINFNKLINCFEVSLGHMAANQEVVVKLVFHKFLEVRDN